MQRLGCLAGRFLGNQHLYMQRQHSSQVTSTLGNTQNLNIGSYTKENVTLVPKPANTRQARAVVPNWEEFLPREEFDEFRGGIFTLYLSYLLIMCFVLLF